MILQRSNLTPIDALQFAQGKINKIRKQYLGSSASWSDNVKVLLDQQHKENVTVDTSLLLTFINYLCAHLEGEDDVEEWSQAQTHLRDSLKFCCTNEGVLYIVLYIFTNGHHIFHSAS